MKQPLKFGVLFVVLALITAACASETTDTTEAPAATDAPVETEAPTTTAAPETTTTTEAPEETEAPMEMTPVELTVGWLLPQSGGLAVIVDSLINAVEMAADEINAQGGNVSLIGADSGTDPAIASQNVDQLLSEGVPAIIGAAGTPMTLSIIDKVTGSEVVQCSPSNTGAGLSSYDDGGYYFRTAPSDVLQGPAL
ncbi:MAG: ABC transporter substrate-binding protein, partial [Acidimicrobiia bacterium]